MAEKNVKKKSIKGEKEGQGYKRKKSDGTEFRCRQWDGEMMYMGLYIEYIMYIKGIVYNIPAISEKKMKNCKILCYSLCKVIIVE